MTSDPQFSNDPHASEAKPAKEAAREERREKALDILLDAWEGALDEGIEPDLLADSAIFAAFTDMVENHGEEVSAQLAEGLAARIRSGEFTLVSEHEE